MNDEQPTFSPEEMEELILNFLYESTLAGSPNVRRGDLDSAVLQAAKARRQGDMRVERVLLKEVGLRLDEYGSLSFRERPSDWRETEAPRVRATVAQREVP